MKTKCISNSALAHSFATVSFSTPEYTTGSHMFTEDNIIYSYGRHFPIARKLSDRVALFTLSRRGNATAKHINITRRALSHYRLIYCYDINIGAIGNNMHTANLQRFIEETSKYAEQVKRARALNTYNSAQRSYMNELSYLTRYCEYFGLPLPMVPESGFSEERRAELSARADRTDAEKIEMWLTGKSNKLPFRGYNAPVLIRYNDKDERFETSKNALIPLEAARRFAADYVAGTLPQGARILSYTVDSVGADYLKIGCHTIETKLINELIDKYKLV